MPLRTSNPALQPAQTRLSLHFFLLYAGLLCSLLSLGAKAQVAPSAYRQAASLWAGAEYSNMHASFPYQSSQRLSGYGFFADFNWNGRIGIEGDTHILHYGGFYGSTESSYLAGPRYFFPQLHRLQPYAKFLIGAGHIHYPFQIGDASYFAIAPGGGVNYHLNHRFLLRAEYEYQRWLSSPGFANEPHHSLTPNGFHLGVAYRIFH